MKEMSCDELLVGLSVRVISSDQSLNEIMQFQGQLGDLLFFHHPKLNVTVQLDFVSVMIFDS